MKKKIVEIDNEKNYLKWKISQRMLNNSLLQAF